MSMRLPSVKLFSLLSDLPMIFSMASQWRFFRDGFLRLVMTGMPCLKCRTTSFSLGTTSLLGKPAKIDQKDNNTFMDTLRK